MDAKHRLIQISGVLAIIAGLGVGVDILLKFALLRFTNVWDGAGGLLAAAIGAYLVRVGRRAIDYSKGRPKPPGGFGWGRLLFGTLMMFSEADQYFHLSSTGRQITKPFQASTPVEAFGIKMWDITALLICSCLIISGIRAGFRGGSLKPDSHAAQPHA